VPLSIRSKTSQSPKSDSGSKLLPRHRLKRTLKRKPEFHEISEGDLKYLWAAYKLGSFGEAKDITQEEFNAWVSGYLDETDRTYILVAETNKGKIPVGMLSGRFNGPLFFVWNAAWFKWATNRNKYETVVNALNELRKDYVVIMHNHMDDKKFYEIIAKHGVTRQVGRLFDVYDDCPAQEWQTRKR